jgi:hypothetical protein
VTPLTLEETIQIGYGCGLNTLEEAYNNIMNHYDCFFLIADINNQISNYIKLFEDAGYIITIADDIRRIKDITLIEVAKDLGYELKEIDPADLGDEK